MGTWTRPEQSLVVVFLQGLDFEAVSLARWKRSAGVWKGPVGHDLHVVAQQTALQQESPNNEKKTT